ncbi:Imm41 family immunity protein [Pasteurella multocida]|uniref:Imm41 family immunity protein n=1 Tax=Pasteurella multocida TaxID=747 RepID=UPI003CF7A7D3
MNELLDFYRNITFFEEYDENSFIGRWLDYSEWNDKEYWKLEKDLLKIAQMYRTTNEVFPDILIGVMRIIELLMIPNWNSFIISNSESFDIYDRYERFKYIISILFNNKDVRLDGFSYTEKNDDVFYNE